MVCVLYIYYYYSVTRVTSNNKYISGHKFTIRYRN